MSEVPALYVGFWYASVCADLGVLFGNALQLHIDVADVEMVLGDTSYFEGIADSYKAINGFLEK